MKEQLKLPIMKYYTHKQKHGMDMKFSQKERKNRIKVFRPGPFIKP